MKPQGLDSLIECIRILDDYLSVCVFVTKPNGEFIYKCPIAKHKLNLTNEDFDSLKNIRDIIDKGFDTISEILQQNDEVNDLELGLKDREGNKRTALTNVKKIFFDQEILLFSFNEITELKLTEQKYLEEKELTRHYLDVAGVLLVAISKKQEVTLINQKGCEILGCNEDEIIGKNWFDHFIPPEISGEIKEVFSKVISGEFGNVEHFENYIVSKSGEKRLIEWHNSVLKDSDGNITGVFSSGNDITEQRNQENLLKESKNRLHQAQLLTNIGNFTWNIKTGEIRWSDAMFELLKYHKDEVIDFDKVNAEMHHPDDIEKVNKWLTDYINSGEEGFKSNEYRLIRNDGEVIDTRVVINIIREKGKDPLLFGTVQDITEQKLVKDQLLKNSEHLEKIVAERTAELEEKNNELERFNNLFVGREFRIKELRDQVADLKRKLNEK